ncbi:MAG: hypothetical protein NVS3B10_19470 [Polyangiales bacterium]
MTRLRFLPNHALAVLAVLGPCAACAGRPDGTASGAAPSGPTASTPSMPSTPSTTCDASAVADIEVSSDDLDGYPPYAVAGCTLVYVRSGGELVLRDLGTRAETILAGVTEHPRRPTVGTELIAWEGDEAGRTVVRVREALTGLVHTVGGMFVSAGEPRARGTTVAFTAWNGPNETDDTDVWLYEAGGSGDARLALGGPGQQRFCDVSNDFVSASDFSEDPDQRFDNDGKDLADIVVLDRATGRVVHRHLDGKQAFPMLASEGVLAYLDWSGIHPEPKFQGYSLRRGAVLGDPAADRTVADVVYVSSDYARPAVVAGMLEWIANPDGRTTLYRAPADGSSPPAAVAGLEELRLYAPSPTSAGFTVLAASRIGLADAPPRLRAIPR